MPKFVENSSYENVCIYVKITWPDGMKPMVIISFHEDEEQNFTFKMYNQAKLNMMIIYNL